MSEERTPQKHPQEPAEGGDEGATSPPKELPTTARSTPTASRNEFTKDAVKAGAESGGS